MAYHVRLIIFLLLSEILRNSSAGKCDRKLDIGGTPADELEGKFFITMWTMNKTDMVDQYMPNTRYIVSIEGEKPRDGRQEQKFTRFLLTADNQNESSNAEGTFDLIDDVLTQFSDRCTNAVTEATQVLKERIDVAWVSPPEGSGCILIRATVAESPETWYMEEGGLVRSICQDPRALEDDPGPVLSECSACDEAKYEVTFEGLWSRNTHPKDFPSKGWLIRFSDVIGASHTVDYRFWRYNDTASEGLQQVAEFGSTRKLESELKEQSEHIRTIIKARGISHPNVTGRTFAVFRVDRKHHLMSLVSMIVPSPDWIVGVSGLELCLSNGSWIEHKELNLYPVDAGTDDGITYMSPDSPTDPPEPIRRITSTWPNDTRSPFYDSLGQDMKPMAKLHLNRQRLYEKTCNNSSYTADNTGGDFIPTKKPRNKACKTKKWGDWGPCSVSCGYGVRLRQRHYKDPQVAKMNNCNVSLTDKRNCIERGPNCQGRNNEESIVDMPQCALGNWTDWSECTTTCGPGLKTRSRKFLYKNHRKHCRKIGDGIDLEQTFDCENEPCENGSDKTRCPELDYTPWSSWSPCSATCGQGIRIRSRQRLDSGSGDDVNCKQQTVGCSAKIRYCNITKEVAEEICNDKKPEGDCSPQRASYISQRVYFDPGSNKCRHYQYTGCNSNRKNDFDTLETCQHICIEIRGTNQDHVKTESSGRKKNYKVSLSSVLSYHTPVQGQRSGKIKRARHGENSDNFHGIQTGNQIIGTTEKYNNGKPIDCKMSDWSSWTPCNSCRGFTRQSRNILIYPRNGGKQCEVKLEKKHKCHNVLNCPRRSHNRRRRYRDYKSAWNFNEVSVDCQLTHWSSWSTCNSTCANGMQRRTRTVRVYPHGSDGKPCTKLIEFRKCKSIV